MPQHPTWATWKEARDAESMTLDREMYFDIGVFMVRYAMAELNLTSLLAYLTTGTTKLEEFEMLTSGMDARVKIHRIIKAANHVGVMHPSFRKRLDFFEERIGGMRNKIAHSTIIMDPDDKDTYLLFGVGNPPYAEFKIGEGPSPYKRGPLRYTANQIYAASFWTSDFTDDISAAWKHARAHGTLEIAHPRSPLRQEGREGLDPLVDLATYRTLQGKAA